MSFSRLMESSLCRWWGREVVGIIMSPGSRAREESSRCDWSSESDEEREYCAGKGGSYSCIY